MTYGLTYIKKCFAFKFLITKPKLSYLFSFALCDCKVGELIYQWYLLINELNKPIFMDIEWFQAISIQG